MTRLDRLLVLAALCGFAFSGCSEELPPEAPDREFTVMQAAKMVDEPGDFECGPFVDGVADVGRDFESGLCKGESCSDSCGCICAICTRGNDDDFGLCVGLCSGAEGCEALSLPGTELTLETVGVLVKADL